MPKSGEDPVVSQQESEPGSEGRRQGATTRLVAVSKTIPAEAIAPVYDAGQRSFGENRVQELQRKAPLLPSDCEWHLIGHLQKNKVRAALRCAAWIHSVDSTPLVQRIDRIAGEEDRCPTVLLQVNAADEESKFGVSPDNARLLLDATLDCANVRCRELRPHQHRIGRPSFNVSFRPEMVVGKAWSE